MNITEFVYALAYVAVAFITVYLSGWLIYDKIATRKYSLSEAIFKDRNMAAGLEVGAFLFVEILIAVNALSGDSVTRLTESGERVIHYARDLEAVAITILFSNLVFFVFRWIGAMVIERIYRGKIDNQGDAVGYNNEIFKQQNLGASLFSISYLMVMYFMISQEDFLGTAHYWRESYFNMGSVLLLGIVVMFLHKMLFLSRGHTTLDELFLDNNSGVGMSLCGFMFAFLFLQNKLMEDFVLGEHFFKTETDAYLWLLASFVAVVLFRWVFTVVIGKATGRNFQVEFVEADNPVVGLLDMIFTVSCALLIGAVLLA
jgi:hypothetical protein